MTHTKLCQFTSECARGFRSLIRIECFNEHSRPGFYRHILAILVLLVIAFSLFVIEPVQAQAAACPGSGVVGSATLTARSKGIHQTNAIGYVTDADPALFAADFGELTSDRFVYKGTVYQIQQLNIFLCTTANCGATFHDTLLFKTRETPRRTLSQL